MLRSVPKKIASARSVSYTIRPKKPALLGGNKSAGRQFVPFHVQVLVLDPAPKSTISRRIAS